MLKEKLKNYNVILASGSPRRQQLLRDLGMDFSIQLKNVEEIYPDHLQGVEITDYLCRLKASAFNETIRPQDLIITSDTIVWHNNQALGKPKDYRNAFEILKSLSDTTHQVYTSVCIKSLYRETVLNDLTQVTFGNLTEEMIHFYLENYNPFDKAGAYGIQDWIGNTAISCIEGSYTNVMGLPTEKLFRYLLNLK